MSNYLLIPPAGQSTHDVTPTTVSYGLRPGTGDAEPHSIHRNFNDPLWKTKVEILDLKDWREGWNGYDSAAPNRDSIVHALRWIEDLYEDVLMMGRKWLGPQVVADAHGNVVFEWWEGREKLTVYVHPEMVEYVKVWGPDIFSEMEDGEVEGAEDRRALWNWLTR